MSSGIVRRTMVYLGLTDDDEFEYEGYEDAPAPPVQPQRRTYAEPPEPPPNPAAVSAGVAPAGGLSPAAVSVRPMTARESAMEPGGGVAVTPTPRPSVVRPISTTQPAKVHVVTPSRFADAQEIGDRFKNSQPVVVDLHRGDRELSRRMIDFCSGITYALGGGMEKVADQVFLLTPSNVEISADEKRKLAEKGLYRI
ncbi:MAG: cell division protein SepF [Acidimicrobiaceae bacterium]|nr:cell division protein SepF [Acidimicrobiaceae bacterium]